ncbi:MAG: cytochrome c family protein [Gemmobacter sp.]|jgi:cytochrome c|nr:cytochrome c family protein [Gemmobacter sp.]
MFDTMTITKVLGAVCGSLLVFLLGNWAAGGLYSMGGGHGGDETQAYSIAVADGEPSGTAAGAEAGPSFEEVFASADPAKGEKIFAKCKACHHIDGSNATGPHLNGVVNRAAASVADFHYSEAMQALAGESWEPARLDAFLTSPKAFVPGTAMSFAGLPKIEDRANLVKYLETLQ